MSSPAGGNCGNSLANIIPFNGQTTGEVSDNLSNYFVPAGYVFSILGLISLGLVAYAIFQVRPVETQDPRLKAICGWVPAFQCGQYRLAVLGITTNLS